MKASLLQNHQTHGDLDIGTFVFDAMGQRWAGELGSDQYLGDYYFSNETQDSARWTYYRKRTEGQNTIMINRANQLVGATPSTKFESSGTAQGGMPSVAVQNDDTAYMTVDMSSAYGSGITAKRGIRFLNGRTQLLVQDEVSGASGADIQWRMHTNATKIDLANDDNQATLTLNGKTLVMNILNANGLKFATTSATPQDGDATPVQGPNPQYDINMDNSGVTVLYIDSPNSSSFSSQVLFTPQWPDKSDYVTNPSSVAIDNWSLASHN
jgi:hypothetical protein